MFDEIIYFFLFLEIYRIKRHRKTNESKKNKLLIRIRSNEYDKTDDMNFVSEDTSSYFRRKVTRKKLTIMMKKTYKNKRTKNKFGP